MKEDKLTLTEFGATIKEKYPQYRNVPDEEVGHRMLSKYPQYKNKIKDEGVLSAIGRNIVMPFARMGANLTQVGQIVVPGGTTAADIEKDPGKAFNVPWLGSVKPVGREGNFGEKLKDSLGVGAEIASVVVPAGKLGGVAAKATLGGRIAQGSIAGLKAGALGGALYGAGTSAQNNDSLGEIATSAAAHSALGAAGGGVIGGALPVPAAAYRTVANRAQFAPSIMQRVARVTATDQEKFKKQAGESIGEYLTRRGIYGTDEEIAQQLVARHIASRKVADEAIAALPGTYKHQPVRTALKELLKREKAVSSPGAPSRDLARVDELLQKYNTEGLTMAEIN